jgi:hypothetical protein
MYVSMARVDHDELARISRESSIRNKRRHISGFMVVTGGVVVQVLEGKERVLEPLIEKIKADPRHERVQIVYNTPIAAHNFPNWSMIMQPVVELDVCRMVGGNPAEGDEGLYQALCHPETAMRVASTVYAQQLSML